MSPDLWQRGCDRLAAELPEQQFNTWIRPLPSADVSDRGDAALVSLRVPNRFKLDWIRDQYARRIESVLSELAGKPVRLELLLAPREPMEPLPRPAPASPKARPRCDSCIRRRYRSRSTALRSGSPPTRRSAPALRTATA